MMINWGGHYKHRVSEYSASSKNVLPYAMSKSALGHMTKGHALEWGEHGVRVNGLAPGFILTDLTEVRHRNKCRSGD